MKSAIIIALLMCFLCGCTSPEVQPPAECLTEEDLVMAYAERLWPAVFSESNADAGFASLTENQKVFFALNYLDMEIANGGLCQFFVNDGGMSAPYISGYLEVVGAEEHRALFDGFVAEHGIDVHDLSDFAFTSIENYVKQYQSYPFDEFDDAYYELKPLSGLLAEWIRSHPEDFPAE